MSLQGFIDRILGRANISPSIAVGISDDGTANPVTVGKPSPFRVDPTTGALLVSSSGGGGGGGDASAANQATQIAAEQAIRAAVESIDGKTPASPAQDRTTFGSPSAVRIANAGANAFVTPFVAGDNVLSDLRVGSIAVSNSNPVPISDAGGSITVDGTVAISGSVAVAGPLTDVQLRASAVPVSGSDGTNARTIATTTTGSQIVSFDNANTGPFGDLIAEGKKAVLSRHWTILNAFDPQQDETVAQANGATVTISSQRLALASGTTNAADACYRTIKTAQYRPGQGFVFRWTAAFTTGVANSTQEIGFGNGANGGGGNAIAVGYNGTSFGILHRNAGSSAWVARASWNGDKLDGSGASGVTLDPTKLNVFFAHVPFLGAGTIHFYAMLPSGTVARIHSIQYPNSSASLEFSDPAFRFYGRVVSTGSTTNLVAYSGSAAAFTVGNIGDHGQQWAESRTVSVNGTAAIMSIRCATSVNNALNNTPLRIRSIALTADNGNTTTVGIGSFGVTLGGTPAFAALTGKSASTADNGVTLTNANTIGTVDIAGTTVTGGDPIWNTATPRNNTAMSGEMEENPIYIFPGQTLTLYATTGTATNVTYAINGTVG